MPCNLHLMCVMGMPSNLYFSNTDFRTLAGRSSNSQMISLVYRMVVMYDGKIKYVAYVSRLQSNHLNQGA